MSKWWSICRMKQDGCVNKYWQGPGMNGAVDVVFAESLEGIQQSILNNGQQVLDCKQCKHKLVCLVAPGADTVYEAKV